MKEQSKNINHEQRSPQQGRLSLIDNKPAVPILVKQNLWPQQQATLKKQAFLSTQPLQQWVQCCSHFAIHLLDQPPLSSQILEYF